MSASSDQLSSTKKKRKKPAANNPWRKAFFNSQRYITYLEDEMKKGKAKFPGGKGSKKC